MDLGEAALRSRIVIEAAIQPTVARKVKTKMENR